MGTEAIAADEKFDAEMPLLIIGAGAAGLCAALAAKEAGIDAGDDRARCRAGRLDRAVGRPHSRRGHAVSARQGHRRRPALVRRRHPAQGARRSRRRGGRRRRREARAAGRMAGGPLRPAVRCRRQFQLSGTFGVAHAWSADPHRAGTDRRAAQRRGSNATSSSFPDASPNGCWRSRTAASTA